YTAPEASVVTEVSPTDPASAGWPPCVQDLPPFPDRAKPMMSPGQDTYSIPEGPVTIEGSPPLFRVPTCAIEVVGAVDLADAGTPGMARTTATTANTAATLSLMAPPRPIRGAPIQGAADV